MSATPDAAQVRPQRAAAPRDPFTPYVDGLRARARADLDAALRQALGLGEGIRVVLPRPEQLSAVPLRIDLEPAEGGRVRLSLAPSADGAWRLGPFAVGVAREADGVKPTATAAARALLRALAARLQGEGPDGGAEVARALSHLRLLHTVEDRHYRHVEHAHNGLTAFLRVGFRCNQDCYFCWQGRQWPAPPDDLVFTWLDELASTGAKRITVSGGEPTLWRPIADLVRRAVEVHGMTVHMNTNAIQLKKDGVAARLKAAGVTSLLVSLHSSDPDLSDRMTRAPNTHWRTVEGIHAALDAGLFVILNCLVEKQNLHTIADHARFVREQFVEQHPDNPVRMVNYSQPGPYFERGLYDGDIAPYDAVRPILTEAARTLHGAGVLLEIAGTCGFPPCILRDLPEALPWRGRDTMDVISVSAREHVSAVCDRCAVQAHCIGPRREYLSVHGDRGLQAFDHLPTSDWYERLAASPLGHLWAPG